MQSANCVRKSNAKLKTIQVKDNGRYDSDLYHLNIKAKHCQSVL